jgi:hypothetical protein
MSRVKNSAPSDPPALPKSEDTLDSASPLTSNTVARARPRAGMMVWTLARFSHGLA